MAPLEVVWKIVSDFYESYKWFPGMKSCERVEGAPEKGVGSVRRCVTSVQEGNDSFGVEKLIAVDDTNHSYSYRLTDTNMQGFDGYQATIKVCEAKEEGNCLLKWSFELNPAAGHSKEDTEGFLSSAVTAMTKNLEQLASSQ
ncbi:hypothetical protein SUGI_0592400 [Cryptomeria japonica]|uniref:lachrymatory-factor synthase-like n=1 Tax=Cryptomeria japonica TaxID=3369 RepID=UPI0024149909|nr:lachrymatory-factor synthase-like [Cryptomeria japonica]GLJ29965.1 hypothetical protein SUGI_0592350 [Cryptomeria japonica]GLJ29967.1 hypothetical protein SUGI_0592400 [Cryptomeria japonica]